MIYLLGTSLCNLTHILKQQAVEKINAKFQTTLKKYGAGNMKYPEFISTINKFCNQFGSVINQKKMVYFFEFFYDILFFYDFINAFQRKRKRQQSKVEGQLQREEEEEEEEEEEAKKGVVLPVKEILQCAVV